MNEATPKAAIERGGGGRAAGGTRAEPTRWARWLRRGLLCLVGLLYAASIPWYRDDAPPAMLFGLPDWVAVAICCYATAALLNAAAWLLTEIPEAVADDEARRP